MIKFGKSGTVPILEELDVVVGNWIEDKWIVVEGSAAVVVINDDDGRINIVIHDGPLDAV